MILLMVGLTSLFTKRIHHVVFFSVVFRQHEHKQHELVFMSPFVCVLYNNRKHSHA